MSNIRKSFDDINKFSRLVDRWDITPELPTGVNSFLDRMQDLELPLIQDPMRESLLTMELRMNELARPDMSWLSMESPWQTELGKYSGIAADSIMDRSDIDPFSNLWKMEQETASALAAIRSPLIGMTSAMTQLESVYSTYDQLIAPLQKIAEPFRMLETYEDFACRQNREIQRAASIVDEQAMKWRLDILESTSKYIDRQVEWTGNFLTEIQEEVDIDELPETENTADLPPISQYIGYSKRDGVPVEEALEVSSIATIPEKGKRIACQAVDIKRGCEEKGLPVLFADTEQLLEKYLLLGMKFSNDAESFYEVVEALYDIFAVQKDMISSLLQEDEYVCLNRIEKLKQKKEQPKRRREFTRQQEDLYDDILILENKILDAIRLSPEGVNKAHDTTAPDMHAETDGSEFICEEQISKNIYKALQKITLTRGIADKSENELNDQLRDLLSMVYEVRDQTRQGCSESGRDAGEIDLEICREGEPVAILEGLVLQSVNRDYINRHIYKALTNYDPLGCPQVYMILYCRADNFAGFWERFGEYIETEQSFPYEVVSQWEELRCIHTSLRHAKSVLERDGKRVAVHYYAIKAR